MVFAQAAFQKYAQATKSYDTQQMSAFMHPQAVGRLRATINAAIRGPKKELATTELLPLFSVTAAADFEQLPDVVMLAALESAMASNDAEAVQQAVFDLRDLRKAGGLLDDEVAFEVLTILKRPETRASPLAAHLLNFFEFQATDISQRAKDRCAAFLREWGDTFSHSYSQHVVAELRSGSYLKPDPPKVGRKKPRHNPV